MNIFSEDPYRDALDPFVNDPTDDAVAPMRGVICGLVLSVPCWALLGALGRLVWGLVR